MNEPIPGALEDWIEIEPTRWAVPDHPEYGVNCTTPPLTFEEYYNRRLAQSKLPEPTQPTISDLMKRIEALEKTAGKKK